MTVESDPAAVISDAISDLRGIAHELAELAEIVQGATRRLVRPPSPDAPDEPVVIPRQEDAA